METLPLVSPGGTETVAQSAARARRRSVADQTKTSFGLITLDRLLDEGEISPEDHAKFRSRYERVREMVLSSYDTEAALIKSARDLNQAKAQAIARVDEKEHAIEAQESVQADLRCAIDVSSSKVLAAEQKLGMISIDEQEAEGEVVTAEGHIDLKCREIDKSFEEPFKTAQDELQGCETDVAESERMIEQETKQKEDKIEQEKTLRKDIVTLQRRLLKMQREKQAIREAPKDAARKVMLLRDSVSKAELELEDSQHRLRGLDDDLSDVRDQLSISHREVQMREVQVSQIRSLNSDNRSAIEALEMSILEAQQKRLEISEKRVEVESTMSTNHALVRAGGKTVTSLNYSLAKLCRAVEGKKKILSRAERRVQPLEGVLRGVRQNIAKTNTLFEEQKRRLAVMKHQTNVDMSDIRMIDDAVNHRCEELATCTQRTKDLENELLKAKQTQQRLKTQRDSLRHKAFTKTRAVAEQEVAERKLIDDRQRIYNVLVETKHNLSHVEAKVKQSGQLVAFLTSSRNRLIVLKQKCCNAVVDLTHKIDVLDGERSIVAEELADRRASIDLLRKRFTGGKFLAESLVAEHREALRELRTKQTLGKQQSESLERLGIERQARDADASKLQEAMSNALEERTRAGVATVDRCGELSLLWSRHEAHQKLVKSGQNRIDIVQNKIASVGAATLEVRHAMVAFQRRSSTLDRQEQEKLQLAHARLTEELEQARTKMQELIAQPFRLRKLDRWKSDSSEMKEYLELRVSQLGFALEQRQESLEDRTLVLAEVRNLAKSLRTHGVEQHDETLRVATQSNALANEVRQLNRKLESCVAELSLWQAQEVTLQSQKDALENKVSEGQCLIRGNLAPSDDAQNEWYRMQRDHQVRIERLRLVRQTETLGTLTTTFGDLNKTSGGLLAAPLYGGLKPDFNWVNGVLTTALPRPHAYRDGKTGLPVPYSKSSPFVPRKIGATARHIRNPIPLQVEI